MLVASSPHTAHCSTGNIVGSDIGIGRPACLPTDLDVQNLDASFSNFFAWTLRTRVVVGYARSKLKEPVGSGQGKCAVIEYTMYSV